MSVNQCDVRDGNIKEREMNIYQKIIEVRKLVDFLQKDTQGYQYKYVSGSSVLNAIRPKMDEVGLILRTHISERKQDRYQYEGKDSKGQPKTIIQFVTNITMEMTWINADDPNETLHMNWISSGEDEDPAKANGKAHTYGERYYLLKFFNIPTDNEDPDAHQKKIDKEVKQKDVSKTQTPTMLGTVNNTAASLFKTADDFKMWRVENDLPEKLEGLSDLALAGIWNKLKGIKK